MGLFAFQIFTAGMYYSIYYSINTAINIDDMI